MIKRLLAALALASLTACATTPPNPLTAQERAGVFVEGVSASWSVEDSRRADNAAYVEGKADMQQRLTAAVQQAFANSPAGAEPVEFVVDVKGYNRVGMAQTALIGGANLVIGDVTVRRKSNGETLAVYQGVSGAHVPPAGVLGLAVMAATRPDPVGIMANNFAQNLRKRWDAAK